MYLQNVMEEFAKSLVDVKHEKIPYTKRAT